VIRTSGKPKKDLLGKQVLRCLIMILTSLFTF